jgi:hypothetical protein
MRLLDRGTAGFDGIFKGMAGAFFGGVFLMLLATFLLVCWKDGLAFLGVVLVMIYTCF